MIVTVSVTALDIARGKPGECCDCPVFYAVSRALPSLADVTICNDFIAVDDDRKRVPLPPVARHFVSAFDTGRNVEPFSFELDVPEGLVTA